jgi:hypothetical protein
MKIALVVLFPIALYLILTIWIGYSSGENPKPQASQNNSDAVAGEDKKSAINLALKNGFARQAIFIREFREEIVAVGTILIAIFTVILAFATGFLYFATRDLVEDARHNAERQLRAYALVSEGLYQPPGPRRTYSAGEISIKNFGQTPAHKFSVTYTARRNPKFGDLNPAEWSGATTATVLAPGDKEMFDVELRGIEDIFKYPGHETVDYWYEISGTAFYNDIFDVEWTTPFNLYIYHTGSFIKFGRRPTGNDAPERHAPH